MVYSNNREPGLLIVLSGPSGSGKSTLRSKLIAENAHMRPSISVTTRDIRPNEKEGEDYYFVSRQEFEEMVFQNQFLEYAYGFENYYGTPKDRVKEQIYDGMDVICTIDWQGAQSIKQNIMQNVHAVYVFVTAPSIDVLKSRLEKRNTETPESIEMRLDSVLQEMSHAKEYDYLVVNDDFEKAYNQVCSIIIAEKCRTTRIINKY